MFSSFVLLILSSAVFTDGFEFSLMHDGPIIIGGTLHFEAEVRGAYFNSFQYEWSDNAKNKPHSKTIRGNSKGQWNVTYPKEDYEPGKYEVILNICEVHLINWPCNKKSISFEITADLNGQLQIWQNNTLKKKPFVSNITEVEHRLILKESDQEVLKQNNFTVIVFWFLNCTYIDYTPNFTLRYNYTTADEDVIVKAVLVAAKINETSNVTDTLPETSSPNGTAKVLNATLDKAVRDLNMTSGKGENLNTTRPTESPLNTTLSEVKSTNSSAEVTKPTNGTVVKSKTFHNSTVDKERVLNSTLGEREAQALIASMKEGKFLEVPFKKGNYYTPGTDGSCNGSFFPPIPQDPDKLYGFFHHEVKPRRPIKIASEAGNNWLKNGDLLNYTVSFTGSQPYHHCIQFIAGEHNATGNETCQHTQKTTSEKINIVHYFGSGDKHTVLFIINNSVSKTVTAVVVTNYIAKKHPQLSVVIVPVTFIAIAIILIVFGVAYYIQSINRGPIEVADFDFSATNDTEYKSFKGRLLEALSTAFTRSNLDEEPEEGPTWSPSRNAPNKPRMFVNSSDSE